MEKSLNNYRPDIDGLRAVSIISILFYHLNFKYFSGGFIGVDIFFVISGFLISRILIDNINKKTFNLWKFIHKRFKRILPILVLVNILTLLYFLYYFNLSDIDQIIKSSLSSLFFVSNFFFLENINYFDNDIYTHPLIHTWSLSIEILFYIFFAILFFFTYKKFFFIFSICIIFFFSIFLAQWGGNLSFDYPYFDEDFLFYRSSKFSSYFSPFGRYWEFILGIFAALLLDRNIHLKFFELYADFLRFISIGLIIVCVIFFDENTNYPSFLTIIPTLASFILILTINKKNLSYKILSNRLMMFFGKISYSLYLIHFPIISISYYNLYIPGSNILYDFLILSISVILSFISYKYLEKPVRENRINIKYVYCIMFVVIFILLLVIYQKKNKISSELPNFCFDKKILKFEEIFSKCTINKKNNISFDYLVIGDSHIISYYKKFYDFSKDMNKSIIYIGNSGCLALKDVKADLICNKSNKLVYELLNKIKIKNIIFISKWNHYLNGNYSGQNISNYDLENYESLNKKNEDKFETALLRTISAINEKTNIFIIEQVPLQKFLPSLIYKKLKNQTEENKIKKIKKLSINYEEHQKLNRNLSQIFKKYEMKHKNIKIVNFDKFFCDEKCLIGDANYSFYSDKNHLSYYGVNFIFEKLKLELAESFKLN